MGQCVKTGTLHVDRAFETKSKSTISGPDVQRCRCGEIYEGIFQTRKIVIYSALLGAAFFAQGCGGSSSTPATVFSGGTPGCG